MKNLWKMIRERLRFNVGWFGGDYPVAIRFNLIVPEPYSLQVLELQIIKFRLAIEWKLEDDFENDLPF